MGHNRGHSACPSQTHTVRPIGSAWKVQLCKWSCIRQIPPSPHLSLSPLFSLKNSPRSHQPLHWLFWAGEACELRLNSWVKPPFALCSVAIGTRQACWGPLAVALGEKKHFPHLHSSIDGFIKMSLVNRNKLALFVRPELWKTWLNKKQTNNQKIPAILMFTFWRQEGRYTSGQMDDFGMQEEPKQPQLILLLSCTD